MGMWKGTSKGWVELFTHQKVQNGWQVHFWDNDWCKEETLRVRVADY